MENSSARPLHLLLLFLRYLPFQSPMKPWFLALTTVLIGSIDIDVAREPAADPAGGFTGDAGEDGRAAAAAVWVVAEAAEVLAAEPALEEGAAADIGTRRRKKAGTLLRLWTVSCAKAMYSPAFAGTTTAAPPDATA